tara:strand:+ start:337 stop:909 length:573 start_codon:yes stop_codon:yes gene_type:complete
MPRIEYIEENKIDHETKKLIEFAEDSGAPDPRCVRIFTRNSDAGSAWVKYWNSLFYHGILPHTLKELCRIYISIDHECGYCSTARSSQAKKEGLTEDKINELFKFNESNLFTIKEKAALTFAKLFKEGENSIDKDEVYNDLKKEFTEEEIIELGQICAQTDGVGKFTRSLGIISWTDACEINPSLKTSSN